MSRSIVIVALSTLLVSSLYAEVSGRVINRTTGQPASGVPVTLIQMDQSMDPVAEVFTNNDGTFSIDHDLTNAGGQRTFGMLRAEHLSVNYSHPLPPMRGLDGIEIEIYDSSASTMAPTGRILVLEPGPDEVVVNESYLFNNASQPPVTYRDPSRGSLQFFLPAAARGSVEVEGTGPAGMPLNSSATATNEPGVYQVDFPIRPGSNRIALTYVAERPAEGELLVLPSRYPDMMTRVAAPQGVDISGERLQSLGVEPTTQAQVFEVAGSSDVEILIAGAGILPRRNAPSPAESGGGSPNQISVQPAPIAAEVWWILGAIFSILAIGYYNLQTSKA